MRTRINLGADDMVAVVQSHAATLVRMDFAPQDIKIMVKPLGAEEWVEGQVSAEIDVLGCSEDYIE